MKKQLFIFLSIILSTEILMAQDGKLQIGVQAGFAIPTGQFASGYGPYVDNGYATIGQNYKLYAEYNIKNTFYVGINYIYFTNSMEEGNLRNAFNNFYSTNNTSVNEKSNTQGILGSLLFKGKETPFFIKRFLGWGYSKTAIISATNYKENYTMLQSSSDLGVISGFGIGFYVPIANKWFIELEGDYISSGARPGVITFKDNINNVTDSGESINYNQTVINLNIGVGIFLFND